MRHVLIRNMTGLAGTVEREFFRIERENRTLSSLISGLIAGTAVGLVAWLFSKEDLLLFGCVGASAASIVLSPTAKPNSIRSIVLSYLLASAVSMLCYPIHTGHLVGIEIQCFLAVTGSVFLMRAFGVTHPAAVGSALAFIIYDRDPKSIALLMLAIIGVLTIVKLLEYVYREELRFREFPKEFTRHYYGKEMMVSVPDVPEKPPEL